MINFKNAEREIESWALDILRYEAQRGDYKAIYKAFHKRMKNYLSLAWSSYKIDYKDGLDKDNLYYKISFDYDIPFGFEKCINLFLISKMI